MYVSPDGKCTHQTYKVKELFTEYENAVIAWANGWKNHECYPDTYGIYYCDACDGFITGNHDANVGIEWAEWVGEPKHSIVSKMKNEYENWAAGLKPAPEGK